MHETKAQMAAYCVSTWHRYLFWYFDRLSDFLQHIIIMSCIAYVLMSIAYAMHGC